MEAALQKLPENFRTVVVLREIEGFAYDEIAEILNIHIGTVKSRLLRGRAAPQRAICSSPWERWPRDEQHPYPSLNCKTARAHFSAYLDGAVSGHGNAVARPSI